MDKRKTPYMLKEGKNDGFNLLKSSSKVISLQKGQCIASASLYLLTDFLVSAHFDHQKYVKLR